MDIQTLLKGYRESKAKIRLFEHEIEGLEHLIKIQKESIEYSKTEEIEGFQLQAVTLSDMPKGGTNKFHSVTESAAMLEPPKDLTNLDIRDRIKELKSKKYPIERDVKLVELVLMPLLNVKEEFIIRSLYIDEFSWNEIVSIYSQKFDIREEVTLKRIRSEALNKMNNMLNKSA